MRIALIKLAKGHSYYYDEVSRILLNPKKKQDYVQDSDDVSGILKGIKNHEIELVYGTLNLGTSTEVPNVPSEPNSPEVSVPPVITGIEDKTIFIYTNFNNMSGVKAMDNKGNDITRDVRVSGDIIDTNVPGVYTLIYTVSDKAGNEARQERVITVVDNVAPTFTGLEPKTITQGTPFNALDGVEAEDNVDGPIDKESINVELKPKE